MSSSLYFIISLILQDNFCNDAFHEPLIFPLKFSEAQKLTMLWCASLPLIYISSVKFVGKMAFSKDVHLTKVRAPIT